jgi:hypothetical protein
MNLKLHIQKQSKNYQRAKSYDCKINVSATGFILSRGITDKLLEQNAQTVLLAQNKDNPKNWYILVNPPKHGAAIRVNSFNAINLHTTTIPILFLESIDESLGKYSRAYPIGDAITIDIDGIPVLAYPILKR